MYNPKKKLTKDQEKLILENADDKTTVAKLAAISGAKNYQRVYAFCIRKGLEVKLNTTSIAKQKADGKRQSRQLFNVHAQSWY